jgi:hypothetical protein
MEEEFSGKKNLCRRHQQRGLSARIFSLRIGQRYCQEIQNNNIIQSMHITPLDKVSNQLRDVSIILRRLPTT